jgi:hypothetical protein
MHYTVSQPLRSGPLARVIEMLNVRLTAGFFFPLFFPLAKIFPLNFSLLQPKFAERNNLTLNR